MMFTNQTINDTTFALYDPASNLSMPGSITFNLTSVDSALELAWKMGLFAYYYCAPKFEENPMDLSQFYIKIDAMLKNPILQFRW